MIDEAVLQRIWNAHDLGEIRSVTKPTRGVINDCRIVNDAFVIRFDTLDYEDLDRYVGERIAYDLLRGSGVPVPDVIALDSTKTHAPYRYLILTKLDGVPVADEWQRLAPEGQAAVARSAGECLAVIHQCQFDGFGMLRAAGVGIRRSWYDYVKVFVDDDTAETTRLGLIDSAMADKLRGIVQAHRDVLEIGTRGRLAHGDYQFENLLQADGTLTGVIDFEWMRSGDPAWDFRLEDLWEETCPGSRAFVYEGYARRGTLSEDHELRVRLYKSLLYLDDVLFYGSDQPDAVAYQRSWARLNALVAGLSA